MTVLNWHRYHPHVFPDFLCGVQDADGFWYDATCGVRSLRHICKRARTVTRGEYGNKLSIY